MNRVNFIMRTLSKIIYTLVFLLIISPCTRTEGGDATRLPTTPATNGGFQFRFGKPTVTISIPEVPDIKMGPHPLVQVQPHCRYQGSKSIYTVSILMPTMDDGMTGEEIASAGVKSKTKQFGLDPSKYRAYRGEDGKTFGMYFGTKFSGKMAQMHAFLWAAYGTHLMIEVHVSKVTSDPNEIKSWYAGFPKARILVQ